MGRYRWVLISSRVGFTYLKDYLGCCLDNECRIQKRTAIHYNVIAQACARGEARGKWTKLTRYILEIQPIGLSVWGYMWVEREKKTQERILFLARATDEGKTEKQMSFRL